MSKKRIMVFVSIALVTILAVGIGIFANRQTADTPVRLLSLGEKYLTELNYEQALVQFLKVIEIDPMNPRGYTGAAEAYIGLGRTEDAITVLQQGLEITGDDGIRDMLDTMTLYDELDQSNLNDINRDEGSNTETDESISDMDLSDILPFGYEDLSVMGYPWGVSAYELQDRGLLKNVEISTIGSFIRILHPDLGVVGNTYSRNPNMSFNDNGLIASLHIGNNDPTIGPRGVEIGMTMEDVVRLFKCDNPEALEFAVDPSPEIPQAIILYNPIAGDSTHYGSTIYFNDDICLDYYVFEQGESTRGCLVIFTISNSILSSIDIYYSY